MNNAGTASKKMAVAPSIFDSGRPVPLYIQTVAGTSSCEEMSDIAGILVTHGYSLIDFAYLVEFKPCQGCGS